MTHSFRAVTALAGTTFAEAIRDRILYGLLAFAIGLILLSAVLSTLTLGYPVRIVTNLSLSSITLAGTIMSILLGVTAVRREIDRRTIFPILAKPIGRAQYLVGKYLGVLATVWLNVLLMTAAAVLMILQYQHVRPFQYPIGDFATHVALLLLRLAVVAAIAIAFSTVVSSTVALIATSGLAVAAYFTTDLRHFLGQSEDPSVQKLGELLYWAAPDFSILDTLALLVHGHPVATAQTAIAAVYAIAYAALALTLGWWAFSRRDLG